ncbi:hypothetical protein JW848_07495, partial [Candidatus Bipolaricaulota bacterium]|nr:hypothetical protein [Candidatus Bipolaricaulota bacterium]
RVLDTQRESLKALEGLAFFRDDPRPSKSGSSVMSHAKAWLTESRLAVGSWNCTESALHLFPYESGCNVEAGIIMSIDKETHEALKPRGDLDIDKIGFMTGEQLDRDRAFLMDALPFQIQVCRNWRHTRYEISVAGETPTSVFTIRLPGVDGDRRLAFSETSQQVSISDVQRALKEHIFAVFQRDAPAGAPPYRGMIIDLEADKRPVWRYATLNDLLQDWAQEQAGTGVASQYPESYELAYADSIDHQYNDSEIGDSARATTTDVTFSYYTMFAAFENMRQRLSSPVLDSVDALKMILLTQPGSLFEICDKAQRLFADPDVSPVYKWFFQEEVDSLLRTARAASRRLGDEALAAAIEDRFLHAVEDGSLFAPYGECERRWIECVRNIAEYGNGK